MRMATKEQFELVHHEALKSQQDAARLLGLYLPVPKGHPSPRWIDEPFDLMAVDLFGESWVGFYIKHAPVIVDPFLERVVPVWLGSERGRDRCGTITLTRRLFTGGPFPYTFAVDVGQCDGCGEVFWSNRDRAVPSSLPFFRAPVQLLH